ncbi:MAG: hypothetical protein ISS73_10845 [Pirellulales bacterium]|nr:hypothetical protein [Pirellulales bacterium]
MARSPTPIGDTILNAIVFNPRSQSAVACMDFENLLASIPRLFDLLDERAVGYVLVGGIAMRVHSPGRNTQDIGLIIPEADLDRIPELRILDQNESFARAEFGQHFRTDPGASPVHGVDLRRTQTPPHRQRSL